MYSVLWGSERPGLREDAGGQGNARRSRKVTVAPLAQTPPFEPHPFGRYEQAYIIHPWRDMLVCVWRGRPPLECVKVFEGALLYVSNGAPDVVRMLHISEASVELPEQNARSALASVIKERGPLIRATAFALLGKGARNAAVRAAITGLYLLSRAPAPTKVFDSVEPAAFWLDSENRGVAREADIIKVAESLRSARI